MKRLSPVLGEDAGCLLIFCPGCGYSHRLPIAGRYTGPLDTWAWNGDVAAPVFSPSLKAWHPRYDDNDQPIGNYICHSFIGCNGAKPGQIIYLSDSTHDLAGQVVALGQFPASYFADYADYADCVPKDVDDE